MSTMQAQNHILLKIVINKVWWQLRFPKRTAILGEDEPNLEIW